MCEHHRDVGLNVCFDLCGREDFCLHQNQECEAHELGMHISLAAGCSPECVVDSMSNTYYATLIQRIRAREQKLDAGIQQQLAALQHLLPNTSIPAQTVH
ncbi:TPA: hypothetical protein ACH3X1_016565 [Trebouxia sp. C0004]